MKISVIITTYNRAHIIRMCMDSLINQNYDKSDYEIIIVNNNSNDDTEEVIEEYIENYPEVNIKYYFIPKPGQVYARQIGILASQHEILSFSDDDGILSPNWLKEISKVFKENKEAAGVAGRINIRWDETPPDWIYDYDSKLGKLDYGNEVKYEVGLYMNAGNLSIKKDVLIDVGGFNPEMIGEWLVGDGETGLSRKLKRKGFIIGWAPDAVMEHYQIAKKNATVADVRRRFINNGICIPYNIYAINKQGIIPLIQNMLNAFKQSVKWSFKKVKFKILKEKKNEYDSIFKEAFYSAQVKYTLKLFFNKEFRNALTKDDWLIKKKNNKVSVK